MRVLIPVLHYYPVIGGLETWTQNIAEGMALRRGSGQAEIFVVTGRVKNKGNYENRHGVEIFRKSLFTLTNLSHSPLIYILSSLPSIFLKSLSLIKKNKINLIHCQGFLSSFLGFLLSLFTKIPYIITVQRLENGWWFKNLIYKKAILCIGVSRAVSEYFEEIGCKNIEVIPNGINLERFKNLERRPHEGFVIMTIARLEKVKGIEYLIGACARLGLPGRPSLKIIGDGPERKKLEELSEKFGLKEAVEFLGQIPNDKIPEYLAMADCFVLPSLKEGFGIAILEAMAAGVPVIASRVGGILDIIENGKNGLLIKPGDSKEIAQAINKIYTQPKLADYYIKNAMAELTQYDWQDIANKVYENYLRYGNLSA